MNTTTRNHIAELMNENTVFITPVGSRLYGLETPASDYDYFVIEDRPMRKNKHSVSDEYDVRLFSPINLHEMLMRKPTHTGLDAIYSPFRVLGPKGEKWMPFIDGFRPGLPALRRTFLSAAIGTLDVKDEAKFKRFRLGLHLANLYNEAARNGGLYNPHLEPEAAAALTAQAEELFEHSRDDRKAILLKAFGEPGE